jgi:magnesium-transporting ATPase (P-type)
LGNFAGNNLYHVIMKPQQNREIIRSINVIYWAVFLTTIMFIVISALYVSNAGPLLDTDPQRNYIINTLLVFMLIVLAPVSYAIPQKLISKIEINLTLDGKLIAYRGAMFIRLIAMEAAAIVIALGFMATGNTNLMYALIIVLLFFMIYKPTAFKIASDLKLNAEERKLLDLE